MYKDGRLPRVTKLGIGPGTLVIVLAGAFLGLFLARFWYELDPDRFAPLGDWPATIALAAAGAVFLAAQWHLALRLLFAPDVILPLHAPFALLLVYILWPEVDLRLAAVVLLAAAGLAVAIGLRALSTPHSGATQPPRSPLLTLNPRPLRRLAPIALALIVFGVYARTLGTHVGRADTFEFQVVAPTLGIAHPTGYPLMVILGKLFSLLPIGSTAFRVNLTSAVLAASATVVVYALIAQLSGRRLIAFVAALAFAASRVVWSQAIVVEVYALNAVIAGVALRLLVGSPPPPSPSGRGAGGEGGGEVYALSLALGLGLSHHLTTILLLPALVLAILIARPRLSIRTTLTTLGLFLLGLAAWLYIPLRWPALHGGAPMTPAEFVEWITGARFGGALILSAWSDPTRWDIVTRFLLEAFGPAGAALAAAGLIGLALRRWRAALLTLVVFAAYVFYGLVYFVPDVSVFLIPAYLVMAIWIGAGAAFLVDWLNAAMWRMWRAARWSIAAQHAPLCGDAVYVVSLTLLLLIPISLLARNFSIVDQRGAGEQAETWGRYVLGSPIPEGAALLVDSEKIAPLVYLQATENLRPDLDILVLGTEQEYRQQLDARLAQGQPIYLARFLPNLPYRLRSLGPLIEVSNMIQTAPPTGAPAIGARFGDVIDLVARSIVAGTPARLTLHWRALADARPNYHVRLRLVDAGGRVWWEDAGAHPVGGYYPTGAWRKGEVVADYHEIDFDPAFPPGAYEAQVGLFPPFGDVGLAIDGGDVWLSVAQLTAPQVDAPPLERAARQIYRGESAAMPALRNEGWRIVVLGVAPIGVTPTSGVGQVRLNWARLNAAGDREIKVSLSLVDSAGQLVWSSVAEPYGGSLRIKDWPPGRLQALLDFHAPDREGVYRLRLGFVDENGSRLPAKCGWLAPPSADCLIGTSQVAGEAIGSAINFDNRVLLTDWSIERADRHIAAFARPGETIDVRLTWRGLQAWDGDYTVFVHLVGPDGRLHGQVDAWPVQGTLPTSAWAVGQAVDDPYTVTLQPDAPSGRYQVEVGWYLLATLRRLPVRDATGRPVDDRFVVGELSVP